MENTVQTPCKLDLLTDIDSSLEKVKAITLLMAYAAKEGSFKCGDEMAWAQQVVDDLINDASSAVEQLAKIGGSMNERMRFNQNESLGNALSGLTVPAVTIEQTQ